MRPIVRISSPRLLRDGRWHAKASLQIGTDVVRLHVSAPKTLIGRATKGAMGYANRYVTFGQPYEGFGGFGAFGGNVREMPTLDGSDGPVPLYFDAPSDEVGCCGFAGEDFGGVFDDIINTVKTVADSPLVRAIPFVGTAATGISMAVDVYHGVKKGSKKAKKRLKKIKKDAARGVPQAKEALGKIKEVQKVDQLRTAAKGGSRLALRSLRRIGEGIRRKDSQAFDVAAAMARLETLEKRAAAQEAGEEPDERDEPIELDYPTDEIDSFEIAGAVISALAKKRQMSPADRRLHAQLSQILQKSERRKLNLRGLRGNPTEIGEEPDDDDMVDRREDAYQKAVRRLRSHIRAHGKRLFSTSDAWDERRRMIRARDRAFRELPEQRQSEIVAARREVFRTLQGGAR